MARGDVLKKFVLLRIADSKHELTVHFPVKRSGVTGVAPVARPANPLTTQAPAQTLVEPTGTPEQAPVTMRCLWFDAWALSSGSAAEQWRSVQSNILALAPGAIALARVRVSDVADDPENPDGTTLFHRCAHVEHGGKHYRVIRVEPVGGSFFKAYTYYVWLGGAA